ncbi:hypothetical protein [Flavobacterium anhuiense]|uniref:hypothetical protein n=1 Tax=Flavobacterium anhuiense TaxID=459526 RepID=UPI003D95B5EB
MDTIYLSFNKSKYNVRMDYPEEKNGFKNRSFTFNYKKDSQNSFVFELDRNKVLENKKVEESFLKKNKNKIINMQPLKTMGYQDAACNVFNRLKVIYVIDFTEKKGGNVELYRVLSMNICYVKE